VFEIHSVDRGHEGRRQEDDGGDGEDLDDAVLLDPDHAEGRIEEEGDLAREKSGVIADGVKVARDRLDSGAAVFGALNPHDVLAYPNNFTKAGYRSCKRGRTRCRRRTRSSR
jgi:hypothetical protein